MGRSAENNQSKSQIRIAWILQLSEAAIRSDYSTAKNTEGGRDAVKDERLKIER